MLPRTDRNMQSGEEREPPARILTAAGRAELWAAGNAASNPPSPAPAPENIPSPLAMREDENRETDVLEMDHTETPFRRTSIARKI
jgi:hypothetical protein